MYICMYIRLVNELNVDYVQSSRGAAFICESGFPSNGKEMEFDLFGNYACPASTVEDLSK